MGDWHILAINVIFQLSGVLRLLIKIKYVFDLRRLKLYTNNAKNNPNKSNQKVDDKRNEAKRERKRSTPPSCASHDLNTPRLETQRTHLASSQSIKWNPHLHPYEKNPTNTFGLPANTAARDLLETCAMGVFSLTSRDPLVRSFFGACRSSGSADDNGLSRNYRHVMCGRSERVVRIGWGHN